MSVELSLDKAEWQLEEVRLHLSAAGGASENFAVALVSGEGSRWNTSLHAQDMNAETDDQYLPTRPLWFRKSDAVKFTYTNTNSKQWGLEVIYR